MRILLLFLLLLSDKQVLACGESERFSIGGYGRYGYETNYGETTKVNSDSVVIDKSFIDKLINNPTGKEFSKNKYELYYLISIKDKKALKAGLFTLLDLLKNPEYITECDKKVQLYGIKELAFNIARNPDIVTEICVLKPDDWKLVLQYYEKDIQLWGIGYDFPLWQEGYKVWCG